MKDQIKAIIQQFGVSGDVNSVAEFITALPENKRERLINGLDEKQVERLYHSWWFWARDNQTPPEDEWWDVWLLLAGRGFGKTRAGAEQVIKWAQEDPHARIALVGPTAADVRDVMVEGPSGIETLSPPWFRANYEPSKRRVTFPNGAQCTAFSAEEPERLRGPQHTKAWCDELAAWTNLEATMDMLNFGLRVGEHPQKVITTTPKPRKRLKELVEREGDDVAISRGSTYDNKSNLAKPFLRAIREKYQGTRLGQQEIEGKLLDEVEGALWNRDQLDNCISSMPSLEDFVRIVVAIDPAVTSKSTSDETGMIVAGKHKNGHGYVLKDDSCRETPNKWCNRAIGNFKEFGASYVVAEVNNGGDLVETVLRSVNKNIPFKDVRASRGKSKRAHGVAALYEQGRIKHCGAFPELVEQMCTWDPEDDKQASPDRLDALVWAFTELFDLDEDKKKLRSFSMN